MFLGIRTDSPIAELYLYDGTEQLAMKTWQADRQLAHGLLTQLEGFLGEHNLDFQNLKGVFVYRGPGSFTGLRIGITVINTMAYALHTPIVGAEGNEWCQDAVEKLIMGKTDEIVLPFYGAEARITKPKK